MELNSLDKFFPLAYDEFATVADYFDNAPVCISEFVEAKEAARSTFWQYSEDLKLLFDDGQLCKGCLLYTSRCV